MLCDTVSTLLHRQLNHVKYVTDNVLDGSLFLTMFTRVTMFAWAVSMFESAQLWIVQFVKCRTKLVTEFTWLVLTNNIGSSPAHPAPLALKHVSYFLHVLHITETFSKTNLVNVGPISSRRRKSRLDIGPTSIRVVFYQNLWSSNRRRTDIFPRP